ncbi:ribonuclease Z [Rhizocola hellebori]|uniref:Ribonuclease Z n=1 Tax=Rhizocola hellebori TaxID=1392758 RepID=A0A8J3Q6D0_9ACTN|nr:ribonuclease Z [Rhizocola hellebori]GIH04232.1 ribonuclease Z [Rhizocola hellebori]
MTRELIVLGTASQVPTRQRNHNGYLLRFDDQGILFDPGEGTQRQLLLASVAASDITRICITHFHGDHCLGLPGVVQRLSLDGAPHEIPVHYPQSGAEYYARLRNASIFYDRAHLTEQPIDADGPIATGRFGQITARKLRHPVDTYGYRLAEPDGRTMLPDQLARAGVTGPDIGRLQREGILRRQTGEVTLDQVSKPRRGQIVAFIMDTGVCEAAVDLAADADLLVIESTFLSTEEEVAAESGHLTAAQAGQIAAQAGVRRLVLTHFSQRYTELGPFAQEAAKHFSGDIRLAEDLARIPLPPR